MLRHVREQNIFKNLFSALIFFKLGEPTEDIAVLILVLRHEEEGGCMVVLEDSHVIVEDGKLRPLFDLE